MSSSTAGSAAGGRCAARPDAGRGPDPESELAREEIFGPILALVGVPDLDSAIEFANGSRYGNAGSIFTTSGRGRRAYRWGIEAGMLGVNIGVPAPVAWFPFSGWKDSLDGDLHANAPTPSTSTPGRRSSPLAGRPRPERRTMSQEKRRGRRGGNNRRDLDAVLEAATWISSGTRSRSSPIEPSIAGIRVQGPLHH